MLYDHQTLFVSWCTQFMIMECSKGYPEQWEPQKNESNSNKKLLCLPMERQNVLLFFFFLMETERLEISFDRFSSMALPK